jgi:hypothetical protein
LGTKPSTSSLYYLNKELFSLDEITAALSGAGFFNPNSFAVSGT